jgi:predicted DNA-binding transcriptional regulator YafY
VDRLNRLIGIVLLLQSRPLVRAEDIAHHFGISVRTAYRDLRALDESGVPIAAEVGQGYSLVDGYHLPPVIFTREEASAIAIGEKFVERFTDESLKRHMESALSKIRAVLPESTQNHLERIHESTTVLTPSSPDLRNVCANIAAVQEALGARKVLRMQYYASYRDSVDTREVEPIGMLYYSDRWHLIAYCRLREDLRDFRVDRIRAIEFTGETFTPRDGITLDEYVKRQREVVREETIEVCVHFDRTALRYLGNRSRFGAVEARATPDGAEVVFRIYALDHIAGWILSHGPHATVLYPDELRDLVCNMARAVADQYELVS